MFKKCLYGLNEAARQFYKSVVDELGELNCWQSSLDPALIFYTYDNHLQGIIVSTLTTSCTQEQTCLTGDVMTKAKETFLAGKLVTKEFHLHWVPNPREKEGYLSGSE